MVDSQALRECREEMGMDDGEMMLDLPPQAAGGRKSGGREELAKLAGVGCVPALAACRVDRGGRVNEMGSPCCACMWRAGDQVHMGVVDWRAERRAYSARSRA